MDRLRDPRAARSKGRFAWARLNADALFLALLALGVGIFSVIDPTSDPITAIRDQASVLHWAQAATYIAAGLLLALALLRASVHAEVLARCVLLSAVTLSLWRHVIFFGWDATRTERQVVLLIIVVATMLLRFSILLGRDGLVVTRPATRDDD